MKKTLFLLLTAACAMAAAAQIRGNEISVIVSPDHSDWTYSLGESCTFTARVVKAQNLLPGVTVDYELGPEMYPTETKQGVTLDDGTLTLKGKMTQAGFLRCKVTAHVGDNTYVGMATAAYAPETITPVTPMPDDFEQYWAETLERARWTPLNAVTRLLPERCTELDNVYEVSFNARSWGERMYGILTIPKAEGTYPALLRVPGAGVRPYTGDTYTAPGKAIVLEIGIHGVPVTMEQSVYDDLANSALRNYWTFLRDNRDEFYYNRVIVGALRAVDLICSLPQYNGKALGVTGSSQGGFLSIATAALDSRVTFLAPVHPALCDLEGWYSDRACGWPHYYRYYGAGTDAQRSAARYYDTANFARLLKVPGWYSWGYNDDVCPPTSMYAAYNSITAPKELHPYLQTGHFWYQEQWDVWLAWLRVQLGL